MPVTSRQRAERFTGICRVSQIRSARSRRERPHDAGEIEFVPGRQPPAGLPGDPADRVTLDDDRGRRW